MKRLILGLVLVASVASAQMWPFPGPGRADYSGGGGGSTVVFGPESFEPTPFTSIECDGGATDASWSVPSVPTGGAVTCDAVDFVNAGSESMRFTDGTTAGSINSAVFSPAITAGATFCHTSYLRFSNVTNLGFGQNMILTAPFNVRVQGNGGLRFRCDAANQVEADPSIAIDTWYKIQVQANLTSGAGQMWIDGTSTGTCTGGAAPYAPPTIWQYIQNDAWDTNVWIDDVEVIEGACAI